MLDSFFIGLVSISIGSDNIVFIKVIVNILKHCNIDKKKRSQMGQENKQIGLQQTRTITLFAREIKSPGLNFSFTSKQNK